MTLHPSTPPTTGGFCVWLRGGPALFRTGRNGKKESFVVPTLPEATVFGSVTDAYERAYDFGLKPKTFEVRPFTHQPTKENR